MMTSQRALRLLEEWHLKNDYEPTAETLIARIYNYQTEQYEDWNYQSIMMIINLT
jgi:hypothetical protein